jgi:hypothetical protein
MQQNSICQCGDMDNRHSSSVVTCERLQLVINLGVEGTVQYQQSPLISVPELLTFVPNGIFECGPMFCIYSSLPTDNTGSDDIP